MTSLDRQTSIRIATALLLAFVLSLPLTASAQDLTLSKSVSVDTASVNDTLTYTLTFTNNEPIDLQYVTIIDILPLSVTWDQVSGGPYVQFYPEYNYLVWSIPVVASGTSVDLTFDATVNSLALQDLLVANSAFVASADDLIGDSAITVIDSLGDPDKMDLRIDKSASVTEAYGGDTVLYSIAITNNSALVAPSLLLFDTVAANLTYIDGSATDNAQYDPASGELRWTVPQLSPGVIESYAYAVVVDTPVTDTSVSTNIAIYGAPSAYYADTANVTLLPDTTVTPVIPTITLDKAVDSAVISAGSTMIYTLTAANVDTVTADSVIVVDSLPTGLMLIDNSQVGNLTYAYPENVATWTITNLTAGESRSIDLTVLVDSSATVGTQYRNFGLTILPDTVYSDTVSTTVVAPAIPDLSIDKAVDSAEITAGSALSYTLTVSNVDAIPADSVVVRDTLPLFATYVQSTPTAGVSYAPESRVITWTFSDLPAGAIRILTINVTVDDTASLGTTLVNYAVIESPELKYSDTVTTTVTAVPIPSLSIDKAVDSTEITAGSALTYTLTVSNTDVIAADSVVVRDTLPAFTTYSGADPSDGVSYTESTRELVWTFSDLPAEGSRTLAISVTVDDTTLVEDTLENYAIITTPALVYSDTVLTTLVSPPPPPPPADLSIDKAVDSIRVTAGSFMTYTLSVTNEDTLAADTVVVVDTLPPFTMLASGTPAGELAYDEVSRELTWSFTNLLAEETRIATFRVDVDSAATVGFILRNYATITIPYELVSDTVATTVEQRTGSPDDLEIQKSVSSSTAFAGDTLLYSIVVRNTGDDPILNISYTDILTSDLSYVTGSASGGGSYDNGSATLTWNLAILAGGDSSTVTFRAVIDPTASVGTQVTNRANIVAPDLIAGNTVVTVVQAGEFTLVKNVDKSLAIPGDSITYTLSYSNVTGPILTDVTITDTLAAGLEYIPGSVSGGTYDAASRTLSVVIGDIPSGGGGVVPFAVRLGDNVSDEQIISNTAFAEGTNLAATPSNTVDFTVSIPGLLISKSADLQVATPGDTIIYTILVSNGGSSAVSNVELTDDLPSDLSLVTSSITVDDSTVTPLGLNPLLIELATLNVGVTRRINYRAVVLETATNADYIDNSAVASGTDLSNNQISTSPVTASVLVDRPRLQISKSVDRTRVRIGSIVRYTITVENTSNLTVDDVIITDEMPIGFLYVDGSSILDGVAFADPTGDNPYEWNLGDLAPGVTTILRYSVVIGNSARPGKSDNVAIGRGGTFTIIRRTPKAFATVAVMTSDIDGAIRGRVIVDCDNDGIADTDVYPSGVDVYLDDGAQSRTNDSGMFYFSPVRVGERLVTLDTRDLVDYFLPDDEQSSVFAHVHEGGESYINWRVCPRYPQLAITKRAGAVPQVKLTKTAVLDRQATIDSAHAVLDYNLHLQKLAGHAAAIEILDSLPSEIRLEGQDTARASIRDWFVDFSNMETDTVYEYRLHDLAPGTREYVTNRAFVRNLSKDDAAAGWSSVSDPATVVAGAFKRIPVEEIKLNFVGAYFESGSARLLGESHSRLRQLADSLARYSDADVRVEGHADYRPINTPQFPSNWELSRARARSVYNWLADSTGISRDRMSYEGFASTHPVDTGHTSDAWAKNRRVEVILEAAADVIDMDNIGAGLWSDWTSLQLPPVAYDTVIHAPDSLVEGLNDLWQVTIEIVNDGPGSADSAVLTDKLPLGVRYIDGSASVDGTPVTATVNDLGDLEIVLPVVADGASVMVRYLIRAIPGEQPSSGGGANISLQHRLLEVVNQRSNDVRFR